AQVDGDQVRAGQLREDGGRDRIGRDRAPRLAQRGHVVDVDPEPGDVDSARRHRGARFRVAGARREETRSRRGGRPHNAAVRPIVRVVAAAVALGGALAWSLRPVRAQGSNVLYVSGMRIDGAKPVAKVRLTNTSPNAADVFSVHYTVRDTSAGIALSEAGAG